MALIGALSLLLVTAMPAHAEAPTQIEVPLFSILADLDNDLAAFWNITRADFCEWLESGEQGEPPVAELVTATLKETGQGALVGRYKATRPLELWSFDDDNVLENPCVDTDDQTAPFATGTSTQSGVDNDLDASLTRTNSFGISGVGRVTDAAGDLWHYSYGVRMAIDRNDDFYTRTEHFTLARRGH